MSWNSITDMIKENKFHACFKGSNIGYGFNKIWKWGKMKFQESTLNELFCGVIIETNYLVFLKILRLDFFSNELFWYE